MASQATPDPPPFLSLGGWAMAAIVFVVLLLIGVAFFLSFPSEGYFYAFLYEGLFAIAMGVVFYLSSSLSRGVGLRIAGVGSFWFGVAMLFGADLATPDSAFGGSSSSWTFSVDRIIFLIVILLLVVIGIGLTLYRAGTLKQVEQREDLRAQWRQQTGVIGPPGGKR